MIVLRAAALLSVGCKESNVHYVSGIECETVNKDLVSPNGLGCECFGGGDYVAWY